MSTQITNYQCPACGGPLRFDAGSGRLKCDYCDSVFTPEEVEAFYAEKDAKAEAAFEPPEQEPEGPEASPGAGKAERAKGRWDESTISADWGEETDRMRAYSCPGCGAELLCELTTAATQCPYCGNPTIVPGQFGGTLKPDYIIPFSQEKDAAKAALKRHFRRRLLLPSAFSRDSQLEKLQGVYVPFWLFNAEAAVECRFDGQNSHTHREGNYRVTRTDHFDVRRSGTVRFERIPTDASRKMPDNLMDSIEPFRYAELKPFSTAYLPGYLADKYDVSIEENAPRADLRCANTAEAEMRRDVRGYQTVVPLDKKVDLKRGSVQYALLPVWLLKVKWQDKSFLYAMNGQTGKLVGDLPVSRGRFWGLFCGVAAAFTALFYFTGLGGAIADFFLDFFQLVLYS